jgi:hypothetical protein
MHRQNRLTAIKKHPDVIALTWLKCSALLNKPLFKFIAIHFLNLTEILLVVKLLPTCGVVNSTRTSDVSTGQRRAYRI